MHNRSRHNAFEYTSDNTVVGGRFLLKYAGTSGSATTYTGRSYGRYSSASLDEPLEWLPERYLRPTETDVAGLELERKFRGLADQWKRATQVESSVSRIGMHPSYQRIIAMGERAIPLILKDLQQQPHHWFWALRVITGESPVPPEAQGNMRLMTQAWLDWGRKNGYLT